LPVDNNYDNIHHNSNFVYLLDNSIYAHIVDAPIRGITLVAGQRYRWHTLGEQVAKPATDSRAGFVFNID